MHENLHIPLEQDRLAHVLFPQHWTSNHKSTFLNFSYRNKQSQPNAIQHNKDSCLAFIMRLTSKHTHYTSPFKSENTINKPCMATKNCKISDNKTALLLNISHLDFQATNHLSQLGITQQLKRSSWSCYPIQPNLDLVLLCFQPISPFIPSYLPSNRYQCKQWTMDAADSATYSNVGFKVSG